MAITSTSGVGVLVDSGGVGVTVDSGGGVLVAVGAGADVGIGVGFATSPTEKNTFIGSDDSP